MWRRLPIESQEWRLVGWAGAVLALTGWADVSVQNAAETLFLKRVGVRYLPLAFLVSSLLLVGTTAAMVRLVSSNRDRAALLPHLFAGLAAAVLALFAAIRSDAPGSVPLLVLLSIQIKAIALVVFWVALGDLLHARQAKRLFAPLMAGLTLGAMFGSFVSEPVGRDLGVEGLLPFSAVVLVVAAAAALPLRRLRPVRLDRGLGEESRRAPAPVVPLPAPEREARLGELWRESRLFRLLLVSAGASGVLGTLLYLEFQLVADRTTAGADAEARLLALYAPLRGWLNGLVLLAQLAVSSRIYARIGVPLAAALSPLVYLLGFGGLSVALSLPMAIGAMAAARVQDHAVYDPAQRILFNLFPEALRSRATGVLEGPVKRLGGALGNVVWLAAAAAGGASWVAPLGVGVAGLWLAACMRLWRHYPSLLLEASAHRGVLGEGREVEDLLDPATLSELRRELLEPDPLRVRTAIELVCDGPRERAVDTLASAAREAPPATRALLVAALDRLLEARVTRPLHRSAAARDVEALLEDEGALDERARADLVQAYGRLSGGTDGETDAAVFERALADPSAAVRLAARAALHRRGAVAAPELDRALLEALRSGDAAARRTAREELRALLLGAPAHGERWLAHLRSLGDLLASPEDRLEAAEALAEIAAAHGAAARPVAEGVLSLRDDPDPRLRAAALRYAGHARLAQHAPWVVDHVASEHPETNAAARDALRALGPLAADALLVEHCFGKRSTRDAVLSLVRELEVDTETLRDLLHRELDWIRHTLVLLHAVAGRDPERRAPEILVQRLRERMDEGLHTALLFLTAIYDEDRIAELDDLLRRTQGERQHAILIEALESFLAPEDRSKLLPLFDSRSLPVRAAVAASELRMPIPTFEEARRALAEDADDLTREIARWAFANGDGVVAALAIGEDGEVLRPVEIAVQMRSIPLFERLSTRQLLDLAAVVHQESHPAGSVVFEEGDDGSCMYFVVDGEVEVRQGGELRVVLGPRGWFGELAVFDGVTRSATVQTTRPTRLIRLERHDLLAVIEELPGIAIGICQSLSRRLREVERRL